MRRLFLLSYAVATATMRTSFLLLTIVLPLCLGAGLPPTDVNPGRAFFVFGDSYGDTGDTVEGTSPWRLPYGSSWPGYPTGRFSNGFIQTDFLASQVLGLPSPPAYRKYLESNNTGGAGGIDFAVGGSGVTEAFGSPPLHVQVDWFEAVVNSGAYSPGLLNNSVAFLSVSGNDYGAFKGSLAGYLTLVQKVVGLIDTGIQRLYALGLRNFMVSSIAPLDCLPTETIVSNFTQCSKNASITALITIHNTELAMSLTNLQKNLTASSLVLLRLSDALYHIQSSASTFGFSDVYTPCCLGFCSTVDASGNPLYSVCGDPDKNLFWDSLHPTQAGWRSIVSLYTDHEGFTHFSPTLSAWAQSLGA